MYARDVHEPPQVILYVKHISRMKNPYCGQHGPRTVTCETYNSRALFRLVKLGHYKTIYSSHV